MIVYRLVSPSGKSYVGRTKFNIEKRLDGHIRCWRRKKKKNKLFSAFDKYGILDIKQLCLKNKIEDNSVITSWKSDNWIIQILCDCLNEEELNDKEKYFIQYYDSINRGYNLCRGGEGSSHPMLLETKIKISNANKGKIFSENHRKNLSEAQTGRIHLEETKRKISNSKIGHITSEETKTKLREAAKPWNKGKVGVYSEETRKRMSAGQQGRITLKETKIKLSKSQKLYWQKRKEASFNEIF